MKVPQTFVPDKDLSGKIKEYMEGSLSERISNFHEDPNLSYIAPSIVIASGIPHQYRFTLTDILEKRAGEKLSMTDNFLFGKIKAKNIPQRDIFRLIRKFVEISEVKNEKCLYARDFFNVSEDFLSDYIDYENLKNVKESYFEKIKINIADACFEGPFAIKNSVMDYVHMAQAMWQHDMEHDEVYRYKDPLTKTTKSIKIKGRYVFAVEEKLGHMTEKQKNEFRKKITILYSQQIVKNPGYDFMDDSELVNAVINIKLESDILGARSLINLLVNNTNEENQRFYNKIMNNMTQNSHYCKSCAERTIEHFCTSRGK